MDVEYRNPKELVPIKTNFYSKYIHLFCIGLNPPDLVHVHVVFIIN